MPPNSVSHGHIPGYPPGSIFKTRKECCEKGVHGVSQAGIHSKEGVAYSVCLSGGYSDDEDHGSYFYYTGAGGRSYPNYDQQNHQTWEHKDNHALQCAYKFKHPLRVVRGGKTAKSSYAPGGDLYRYDGLYMVTAARQEKGNTGFKMCKFIFQRLVDQDCKPSRFRDAELAPVDSSKERWTPPRRIPPEGSSDSVPTKSFSADPVMQRKRGRKIELNKHSSPPRKFSPYKYEQDRNPTLPKTQSIPPARVVAVKCEVDTGFFSKRK